MTQLRDLSLRSPSGLTDALWPSLTSLPHLVTAYVGPLHLPRDTEVLAGSLAPNLHPEGLLGFRQHPVIQSIGFRLQYGTQKVSVCRRERGAA